MRFGIVVSRYNQSVTEKLLAGALKTLKSKGVAGDSIHVEWVPGAFEIPIAAQKLAETKKFAAIIALGCVLKGKTSHNAYISQAAASGIMDVSLKTGTPIAFGVLTPDNMKQARERSGPDSANKGTESAEAAYEMAHLFARL